MASFCKNGQTNVPPNYKIEMLLIIGYMFYNHGLAVKFPQNFPFFSTLWFLKISAFEITTF